MSEERIAELEKALKPFAIRGQEMELYNASVGRSPDPNDEVKVLAADCFKAAATLEGR